MKGLFKIDDEVEWTSGGCGTVKTKRGKVVHVVQARMHPHRLVAWPELARTHDLRSCECLTQNGRAMESYLISVPADAEGKRPLLYWPLVHRLKRVV